MTDENERRAGTDLWHHGVVARKAVTLELDEGLISAAEAEAERTGRSGSDVVEEAPRVHFDSVVEQVWARNAASPLSEEEALTLATSELRAVRQERRDRGVAAS